MASPVKDAKTKHIADGFTEISERGRGYLKSRKPGTEQYTLTTQVGGRGWHRGPGPYAEADEVDTAWVQNGVVYEMLLGDPYQAEINLAQQSYRYEDMATGESVELSAESVLQWVNDLGDSETAAGLSSPTTSVNDDTITFEGLFGAGSRLAIQAQTAALKKLLTLDNNTILSTPTLSGTVYLSFSLRFQRSNGVSIWIDGVEWNENGNNPLETSSRVEFRSAADVELFGFRVPYAEDASGEQQSGTMYLKKTGANLFVDVRIPYAWISTATYPLTIDPTVDPQVGASADDARQSTTTMFLTNPAILANNNDEKIGTRWQVNVPNGATVSAANVNYYLIDIGWDTVDHDIDLEDVDSAAQFTTTASDISDRTFKVGPNWAGTNIGLGWSDDSTTPTPDISSDVEAVLARGGWAANNYMVTQAHWQAFGLEVRSWDGDTGLAAKLHIEYTAGGVASGPFPTFRPQVS